MSTTTTDRLSTVMAADAAVSAASGLVLALAAGPLGAWFDLTTSVVAAVGVLFVGHGAILWRTGRRPDRLRAGARYGVVANLVWVTAAVVVATTGLLTATATIALVVVSLVAGAFGVTQWRLLR